MTDSHKAKVVQQLNIRHSLFLMGTELEIKIMVYALRYSSSSRSDSEIKLLHHIILDIRIQVERFIAFGLVKHIFF